MPSPSRSTPQYRSPSLQLGSQHVLILGVVACLTALAAYGAFGRWSLDAVQRRVTLSTQNLADAVDGAIRFDADRINAGLALAGELLERQPPEAANAMAGQALALIEQHLGTGVHLIAVDSSGQPVFASSWPNARELLGPVRALWERCRRLDCSRPRVSDPKPSPSASKRYILFYRSYRALPGGTPGMVVAALPVQQLSRILGNVRVGAHGIALLRDSHYRLVVREPPSDNPNEQAGMARFSPQLFHAIESGLPRKTFRSSQTGDGIARIDSYLRLRSLPFHLVIGVARRDYLTQWRATMWWAGLWLLGFCTMTLGTAAMMARSMRRYAEEAAYNSALLRGITDGLFVLDEAGRIQRVSESICQILGFRRHELVGLPLESILAFGSSRLPGASDLATGHASFESDFLDKSGQVHTLEGSVSLHAVRGGRIRVVAARDVTERKLADKELRTAAVAFQAQQGILVCDIRGRVIQVNDAFLRMTGLVRDMMIGRPAPCLDAKVISAERHKEIRDALAHEGHWEGLVTLRSRAKGTLHLWLERSVVRDDSHRVTHYVSSFSNAAPAREAGRRLMEMAYYDELTRLPNRALLRARVDDAITNARGSAQRAALLIFDLDFFKAINDSQGHDAGDLLLTTVARRARLALRSSDTLARIGGDEFVVLAQDLGESENAAIASMLRIAGKLRKTIGRGVELAHEVFYPTCSMGITLLGNQASSYEDLLKQADLALYDAKGAGRNTTRFFRPEMQTRADLRARLLSSMRAAIAAREFTMYYQPQVDLAGRLCGAEALLRWQSPSRGLIPPGEFIRVAEESDLIVPLGQWALECVCTQMALWSQHEVLGDLTVAVNVSPRQLRKASFVSHLAQVLQRTGVAPKLLKIEVTESAILDDSPQVARNMKDLRALGISLSVDDFGTGYSSLANLRNLPFDQVKIDKSFVDDIAQNPDSRALVQAIISLASSLDLTVIAEGVESREQLGHLVQAGCKTFQGYLFAKPMSSAEFTRSAGHLAYAAHETIRPGKAVAEVLH